MIKSIITLVSNQKKYVNWKGKVSTRRYVPLWTFYGFTKYHKRPQWLILGWDLEKQAFRTYAKQYFLE